MTTAELAFVELDVADVAVGGAGVGRAESEPVAGMAVFADGALPGERVVVRVEQQRERHLTGIVHEVRQSSPRRREPPCPHVARGCGGCGWQHAPEDLQTEMRLSIVRQALERIGRISEPDVRPGPPLPAWDHRTTVRMAVDAGRVGFRTRRGHDVVDVDACPAANPLVDEIIATGRWGHAEEITIRVGARTGERMVVASPTAVGVEVPDGVRVVGTDELKAGARAWIHEEVAGHRFRVSARSFFQTSPEGAEALVAEVSDALEGDHHAKALADLYAGVGLFAATVGADAAKVVAIEKSASAAADARHNLDHRGAARVVRGAVERVRPTPADAVVADPARAGLRGAGVQAVVATRAATVVLVSCDAGSLGRDARLLTEAGYRLERTTVLDVFAQTPHIEAVTRFTR